MVAEAIKLSYQDCRKAKILESVLIESAGDHPDSACL